MSWHAKRYQNKVQCIDKTAYGAVSTYHHRKPTSLGGTDADWNISILPRSRHEAWHTLFQNWSPERIAQEITEKYLDPDYELVVVKRGKHDNLKSRSADFSQRFASAVAVLGQAERLESQADLHDRP